MQQTALLANSSKSKKRIRLKEPTFIKEEKTVDLIKKNNTEIHIFRYTTLYKIYNKLYLKTFTRPLANLNYYIEDDGSLFAEIKGSGKKYIKDRVLMHLDLLRKIKNNDPSLEYVENTEIKTENCQLSLFSTQSLKPL